MISLDRCLSEVRCDFNQVDGGTKRELVREGGLLQKASRRRSRRDKNIFIVPSSAAEAKPRLVKSKIENWRHKRKRPTVFLLLKNLPYNLTPHSHQFCCFQNIRMNLSALRMNEDEEENYVVVLMKLNLN